MKFADNGLRLMKNGATKYTASGTFVQSAGQGVSLAKRKSKGIIASYNRIKSWQTS